MQVSRLNFVVRTVLLACCLVGGVQSGIASGEEPAELRVLTWNIWHGGREDGDDVGPQRVVDVIRDSGADLVAMQETYGSGELIAKALGFHFHPRGTNVSILSRYPLVEDISVFEEFKCVGALVELPGKRRAAFYSIWLPYDEDIWKAGSRAGMDAAALRQTARSSAADLQKIRAAIARRLAAAKYNGVPVFIAGDFNSMSHLDYSAVAEDEFHAVVDWPTSEVLIGAGFRDSYREVNPTIDRQRDSTWSPRFPEQEQDRIDYIYYQAGDWQAVESKSISEHAEKFPSDHKAVLAVFQARDQAEQTAEPKLRVASYNIRHGHGMDGKVDLSRAAQTLKAMQPDFVGLQEVDDRVARSDGVNQPEELAKQLGMHAAFASFMELQGGRYGLAVLSRFPIQRVHEVPLPEGHEPRTALAVEVRLPTGESIMLINVHFDWVADDRFRFAQATALAEYLDGLKMPYLLTGDFNDEPESRTLRLFQSRATGAKKPPGDHFTFSSVKPEIEIDFLFGGPQGAWRVSETKVLDEPMASDHRPLIGVFERVGTGE